MHTKYKSRIIRIKHTSKLMHKLMRGSLRLAPIMDGQYLTHNLGLRLAPIIDGHYFT